MAIAIEEAKEQVIRAGLELQKSGLIARTWGNVSARISDTQFVITPSGRGYDTLTPEDIVAVNIADCSYEGSVKPSSEKGVHAAVYRCHPEMDFVIHTHQDYATDLSVLGQDIPVRKIDIFAADVLGPVVPAARYGMNGTDTLVRNVEECLNEYPDCRAVLMRNHGPVCFGKSYEDAFHVARTLEKLSSRIYHHFTRQPVPQKKDPDYSLSGSFRFYHRHIAEEARAYASVFTAHPGVSVVLEATSPYIRRYSAYGKSLQACIDDFAQLFGPFVRCLPEGAGDVEVSRAILETNTAFLVKGGRAVCTGSSEDDAVAAAMVLDKSCQAALLAKTGHRVLYLSPVRAAYEHVKYMNGYAKLKFAGTGR